MFEKLENVAKSNILFGLRGERKRKFKGCEHSDRVGVNKTTVVLRGLRGSGWKLKKYFEKH